MAKAALKNETRIAWPGAGLLSMRYDEFKGLIHAHLRRNPSGATWIQLQRALNLPYKQPCPEWTRNMQADIGLVRRKGTGRAFVWSLGGAGRKQERG